MLSLSVRRLNGRELAPSADGTPPAVFYDEKLVLAVQSKEYCALHLYVAVLGAGPAGARAPAMAIVDEDLTPGTSWERELHVRHPRSALHAPQLDVVATARTDEAYLGAEECKEKKYVRAFHPVGSDRGAFLVPFSEGDAPAGARSHARMLSTSSGIDFHEAYEEQRDASAPPASPALPAPDGSVQSPTGAAGASSPAPNASLTPDSVDDDRKAHIVRWHAPLAQALELEVRTVRPALERDRVIAEVDLISSEYEVLVTQCDVRFEHGIATMMGDLRTPVHLKRNENYALCFNLLLRVAPQAANYFATRKPLNIYLQCEVVGDGSPAITTLWTPVINFENSQGPFPKTPALTIPVNSPAPTVAGTPSVPASAQPSALDLVKPPRQQNNLTLMGGLSIVVTGPQFVAVGETFEWEFTIINKSQRSRTFTITFGTGADRDLALGTPGPQGTPTPTPQPAPSGPRAQAQGLGFSASANGAPGPPVAGGQYRAFGAFAYNPAQLRNRAAAFYTSSGKSCGLVPLCQELRVGTLAPHVCFKTRISLLALKAGTHSIEHSRIEDLTNRDSYDVGGMLDVIVK